MRVGDGVCRRLAGTPATGAPHTTTQKLLKQVLAMAAQQGRFLRTCRFDRYVGSANKQWLRARRGHRLF